MDKFTTLTGVAAPLPIHNLDTDKIFPAIYLKTIKRTGLSQWLFQEIRFKPGRLGEPGFRAQPGALPQGEDPGRGREFRLRVEPRARAVGAARFRHPLRHRAELCRHFLQQLLQERHLADQGAQGNLSTS